MGHYCRICGRIRANERFSGRGHRDHICKECQRRPREELVRSEILDELYGFLDQSNISEKNVRRLETLNRHADDTISQMAILLCDIARVKPHRRRRWKFLAEKHPELFLRLKAAYGDDHPHDIDEAIRSLEAGKGIPASKVRQRLTAKWSR